MLKVGQTEEVEITGYTSEGEGVCRIEGCAVFVPYALRGELCRIAVANVGKTAAHARLERVLRRSVHRTVRDCPYARRCGGCQLWDMDYTEELRFKVQKVKDALSRIGGQEIRDLRITGGDGRVTTLFALQEAERNAAGAAGPVNEAGAGPWPYRNKAQFPMQTQWGRPTAGFFRQHTHDVVPIERCLIQDPAADLAKKAVLEWAERCRVPAYDEVEHRGLLRHIFVRKGAVTGQVMVCLVTNGEKLPHREALIGSLRRAVPGLTSLVQSVNRERTNVVLGSEFRTLWGKDFIEDELCGFTFRLSPRSFYQVNHDQAQRLYEKAIEFADLRGTETVLDLYCGTGTITLALSRKAGKVIGVEVVPQAIEDAKENAARNGVENVEFFCADAGEAAKRFAWQQATGRGQWATTGRKPETLAGTAASAQQTAQSLPLEGKVPPQGADEVVPDCGRPSQEARQTINDRQPAPPAGGADASAQQTARSLPLEGKVPPQGADEVEADVRSVAVTAGPDVIVVDPPRKGLAPEVIDAMVAMSPKRIVYVSCDPATLARDVKRITEKGYSLTNAEAFDLFPRTFHVETVCLLSKLRTEQKVEIDLDLSELDLTAAESAATYEEIKGFVQENFGFQVSSLQIAQTKRSLEIPMGRNYNPSKKDTHHIPQCPPEKAAAIRAALEHFQML